MNFKQTEAVVFACAAGELSCIAGNLFIALDAPCDILSSEDEFVICGTTHSGKSGALIIRKDCCTFYGDKADLEAVRGNTCAERRCNRARQ